MDTTCRPVEIKAEGTSIVVGTLPKSVTLHPPPLLFGKGPDRDVGDVSREGVERRTQTIYLCLLGPL